MNYEAPQGQDRPTPVFNTAMFAKKEVARRTTTLTAPPVKK